ncbi:EboA domain-containing protein [Streptomyces sp. NEAU-H22]|uniref:EboA domain-containing protein n=1 Tax=unclassified Streptomyces TaxID=2593676 RepID=UPI00225C061C|nr:MULTISPECIES: EboA domain-containing protein [unclassified Streptomyces]MCX3288726.1 EboA domain-containing protein [Streptomyces sp. NEAU-H22]WMD05234.1 EboA domain-containing protein [Streptomyces sp. FXY-T5]
MTRPRATPAARTEQTQNTRDAQDLENAARSSRGTEGFEDTDRSTRGAQDLRDTARSTQDPGDTRTPSLADLRHHLTTHLDPAARTWLDQALDEAAAHPGIHGPISVWELRLAEAGRRCGPTHADAARVLILDAARAGIDALTRVYFQGTADERRAVLHALHHLVSGPDALPLIEDALRTNDTRLLSAAVGPYAARHLTAHAWRHAVLKCLFTGVPVDHVAELSRRAAADGELARMLGDYAAERTAAGRTVPEDLQRVLDLTESVTPAPVTDHPHGKES